jgi:hypothetical protein
MFVQLYNVHALGPCACCCWHSTVWYPLLDPSPPPTYVTRCTCWCAGRTAPRATRYPPPSSWLHGRWVCGEQTPAWQGLAGGQGVGWGGGGGGGFNTLCGWRRR